MSHSLVIYLEMLHLHPWHFMLVIELLTGFHPKHFLFSCNTWKHSSLLDVLWWLCVWVHRPLVRFLCRTFLQDQPICMSWAMITYLTLLLISLSMEITSYPRIMALQRFSNSSNLWSRRQALASTHQWILFYFLRIRHLSSHFSSHYNSHRWASFHPKNSVLMIWWSKKEGGRDVYGLCLLFAAGMIVGAVVCHCSRGKTRIYSHVLL